MLKTSGHLQESEMATNNGDNIQDEQRAYS